MKSLLLCLAFMTSLSSMDSSIKNNPLIINNKNKIEEIVAFKVIENVIEDHYFEKKKTFKWGI